MTPAHPATPVSRSGWPFSFAVAFALLTSYLPGVPTHADEGMWTLNHFPSKQVEAKYGFRPDEKWLERVRLASVRLARGCSGSFVSKDGLVMTNHHCAHSCIEQLSTAKNDYVAKGFLAARPEDELRCPMMEVNQLVAITDVTARIRSATAGLEGARFGEVLRQERLKIEKECDTGPDVRCDVVSLYNGGRYDLYRYRRFQDVRLVFAPEFAIAFYGGDPDNFMFPRYDLDLSFVRVYENGAPLRQKDYFSFSAGGVGVGGLTFVSGHPGGTSRQDTVAQLAYERDFVIPKRLVLLAEERGMLGEFRNRGEEQKRIASADLFGVENGLKALKGRHETLVDATFFATKVKAENEFRRKVASRPGWKKEYGRAWDEIETAVKRERPIYQRLGFLEHSRRYASILYSLAWHLVRLADELPKPNEKRLKEYADSNLPIIEQELRSAAPIYPELEKASLGFFFSKFREALGPDDGSVRKALGVESPEELAERLIGGTRLTDPKVREELYRGGKTAVAASRDPLIEFVRRLDPDARAVRQEYEDHIEPLYKNGGTLLARARFAVYGESVYPDATFSLRLSYGTVKGYTENGREVKPITTFQGAFDRATGRDPFALPESWLRAKSRLNLATPMNFCTDNDIIGGNSGSPVIDRDARVVGLIFDGNIHSLGGDYGFDSRLNRAVAVHSAGILEALDKVYGARGLVRELRGE